MTIGRYGRAIAVLGLAIWLGGALAGCSTSNMFASLSAPPPIPRAKPKTEPEFTPAALREHQRILTQYGGEYDSPRLRKYVKETVDRLVAASERPSQHYNVTLLNSANVNAFALPNGQIYVTRGLLALADDRAELASVLSHEMAHVIAHHAEIRANQAKQAALVSRVVNDVLTDPEVGALALAKSKIALATFSRAQEFEADGIGVGITARAGFDPYGAERFLLALQRNAELRAGGAGNADPYAMDFLSTHPATPVRIKNVIANARQYAAPGAVGERDHKAYLAQIDGLTYGEDPTTGFVRGRRYEHPKLGFTFTAPPGFTLDNTAQAVLGVGEGGMRALRLDVVHVAHQQSLADYLNSGWIENIDKNSIKTMTINGFEAATATAKGQHWSFRLYAIRFGPEVYRFVYASQRDSAEADKSFRDSVATFRRMTRAEIEDARPLHIRLVTVRAGDTPERMARRMTGVDKPLERFRLINGLDAGQTLRPGERVKIIAE